MGVQITTIRISPMISAQMVDATSTILQFRLVPNYPVITVIII